MAASPGRIQGYLAGRSAVLGVLLALAAAFEASQTGPSEPFAVFCVATAASFAFTVLSAFLVRRGPPSALLTGLQPAWDVGYASALVFLSGGALSPFSTLYSLTIIGAAILLFRPGAVFVATASSLAYGLLVDLQFYKLLRPLNPFPLPEAEGDGMVLQLLFNLVAFYAVAVLSGYLAEELRRTGERLQRAEAEVLDLEHLKESILQNMGSGLVALDASGREVFHNRAAEDLLRRAGAPLLSGMDLGLFFDLSRRERAEVGFLNGGGALGYNVSPLVDRQGEPAGSILIFQDLSKLKRLEEDLRRADRLAAVGRLAAGLAHEIRNPLASLAGSVEVLRQNLKPTREDGQLFAIILRETERLNRLVTNFLHYARPEKIARAEVDLSTLVEETAFFFLQGEGRTGFSLNNRIPEGMTVVGDRSQLEQLLLNLFRNSREAAPDVRVTIEAESVGPVVLVRIRDDGPGMSAEVAQRAFEPFFSDREGGTGLGLATVHRIVENHGGSITLDTRPGGGVVFHVRLPAPNAERAAGLTQTT